MSIEPPSLDDLSFQQIVDHARRRISHYCPEWTDHNVSDPGITLIELFAGMVEMLLYRVNRLPETIHISLLNLLGVQRKPSFPATTALTFYFSEPVTTPQTIAADIEASTLRSTERPPLIFRTTEALTVYPPAIKAMVRVTARMNNPIPIEHYTLDGNEPVLNGAPQADVPLFGVPKPEADDAFYLALDEQCQGAVMRLELTCVPLEGSGIDTSGPTPYCWEVAAPQPTSVEWLPVMIEEDTTSYLSKEQESTLLLRIPGSAGRIEPVALSAILDADKQARSAAASQAIGPAFWLRCRLLHTHGRGSGNAYTHPPRLRTIRARAVGGTVPAENATVVVNEYLGQSDGTPGQRFQLRHPPLELNQDLECLTVQLPDGSSQTWRYVESFALLTERQPRADPHHCFTLEYTTGTIMLPPELPLAENRHLRFGDVPPRGGRLFFSRYRYSDGALGNVPSETLKVLPNLDARFHAVNNWAPASGGMDVEGLEATKRRAVGMLRTRDVAVTARDYEDLILARYGHAGERSVGRASCLAPGRASDGATHGVGPVRVVVLPFLEAPARFLPYDQLIPTAKLLAELQRFLAGRAVLGVQVRVEPPKLRRVTVEATLRCWPQQSRDQQDAVKAAAEAALNRYLNPYVGGPDGDGWPFGRRLDCDEIRAVLQRVRGVDRVEPPTLRIALPGPVGPDDPPEMQVVADTAQLQPDELLCSGRHLITLTP